MTQIKSVFQIAFFMLAFALLSSCGKDPEVTPELTTQEVADILEPALQNATGGLTQYIQTLIDNVEEISVDVVCDSVYTKDIVYNNSGAVVQAEYSSNWMFNLACNNLNIPESAVFDAASNATYSTNRLSSDDAITFTGNLNGIVPSNSVYLLESNYGRIGVQEFSGSDSKSVNSSLVMNIMDVEIGKIAKVIQSGTGSFSLLGDIDGTNFSKSGDITFNGGGMATLTINGETFEIDLN